MLISLTVGKVDAGVAVLLTEDKRLIEFPSILLPPSISSGSIVDITVSRNTDSEASARKSFQALQSSILTTYGQHSPSPPVLRCRNATQTSLVLEWEPIDLATADIRSLSLYRNGSKAGNIPRPLEITATKISGLAVDTEYAFHLMLRTSAGQYSSEKLTVRTHKMTDLSGITVTPGVLPAPLRESLSGAVERIGAKIADSVRIDTTHFVCTEGRGREWEKAVEMNIPVVRPEWVEGCEREGRVVGVRGYYLNADPRLRQVGQGAQQQRPPSQQQRTPPQQPQPQPQPQPNREDQPTNQHPHPTSQTPQPHSPPALNNSQKELPAFRPPNADGPGPTPPAKDTPGPQHASVTSASVDSLEIPTPEPAKQDLRAPSPPPSPLPPQQQAKEEEAPKSPADGGAFSEVQL